MARRPHHYVYVVELSKDVLLEAKFRKCNPMAHRAAVEREVEFSIDLRSADFGVWQA